MKHWQVLEKHETDREKLYHELGFVRKFSGPFFWPKFEALGHSHGNFNDCKCSIGLGIKYGP